MFYYTHTEKARINQISPGYQHKSSHKSKTARNDDNKLRCVTWSGRKSFAVLAGTYTTGVCEQTVLQDSFVRYTSYELLCHHSGLC